jgi:hypothetical protein
MNKSPNNLLKDINDDIIKTYGNERDSSFH